MAVAITTGAYCCANLQTSLDRIASAELMPNAVRLDSGLIRALKDSSNNNGFIQNQINAKNATGGWGNPKATGSNCKMEISYFKPKCDAIVDGCAEIDAAAPVVPNDQGFLNAEVNKRKHITGQFTEEQFRCLCDAPDDRLARSLEQDAAALEAGITADLAADIYAMMGPYSDATSSLCPTAKSINILNGSGHINPSAWSMIRSEYRKMFTTAKPIGVGGDILNTWQDTRQVGGTGTSIGAQNADAPINWWVDYTVDSVIQGLCADTDSHLLTWSPGAVQLLEWYQNVGKIGEKFKENYTATTITIRGIKYDFFLKLVESAGSDLCNDWMWRYQLSKTYDTWCLPIAAYQPCFDRSMKQHYILGCGDFDCADYYCPPPA